MKNPFENMLGNKKETQNDVSGTETGVVDSVKIEKAMKRMEKDAKLKDAYDFWLGKKDSQGRDMQTKLLEFVAENPTEDVVYRAATEEFERQSFQNFN